MKAVILYSIVTLSVFSAKATQSLAVLTATPSVSTLCVADSGSYCRLVIEAGDEAKAYLVDQNTEIGPRLQKAMEAVRAQNPGEQLTNQELAQAVWEYAQQYSE